MHIGNYINMLHKSGEDLHKAFHLVAKEHGQEPDIKETCILVASWTDTWVQKLKPFTKKYGEERNAEPDRLMRSLFKAPRKGSLGMLLDLQDLWLMCDEAQISCILLRQAASGLRDKELISLCDETESISKRQASWLLTRMKAAATQTLVVAK